MRTALPTAIAILLLGALCLGNVDSAEEQSLGQADVSNGTLKLYADNETTELLYDVAKPVPKVFVDDQFVGNYSDLRHNTPGALSTARRQTQRPVRCRRL